MTSAWAAMLSLLGKIVQKPKSERITFKRQRNTKLGVHYSRANVQLAPMAGLWSASRQVGAL
jgi:hypothetical protein